MHDLMAILPIVENGAGAILVMLVKALESYTKEGISILGIGLFAFVFFVQLTVESGGPITPYGTVFNGMLVTSTFTKVAGLIILASGFFSALASQTYFTENDGFVIEYYCMMLFADF